MSLRMPQCLRAAAAAVLLLGGCASADGPTELVIEPARYEAIFDAAIEASRTAGMTAVRRDRRNGVIETEPRIAGSVLEPWRFDNAGPGQALENTVNLHRRRARFEFTPADHDPPTIATEPPLAGADYSGVSVDPIDLTTYDGPIRVRCVVVVERNHSPGMRPNTWTNRRLSEQAELGDRNADLPRSFWTPLRRDIAYESRLLARVQELSAEE